MLDVQPAFLRRLDAEAVVQPARSDSGQRRYTRLDIHLVERVVGLADEGLTLAGIRRLLILEDRVRELQHQLEEHRAALPGAGAPGSVSLGTRPADKIVADHGDQANKDR